MLSTKDRAKLRSLSNNFSDLVYIGKDGVTTNVLKQIDDNLTAHELIKIKVQNNFDFSSYVPENGVKATIKTLCEEIANKVNAEPVSVCGGKIVLYRKTNKPNFKHYL